MFVQVIQGKAKDPAGIRKQFERWNEELRPNARGFLGSTAGVADDGEFIAVTRFESQEAARANSDSPAQDAWWRETEQYLDGEARFYDTTDVGQIGAGGSDDAGFVQVIQGTAKDRATYEQMERDWEPQMKQLRPDVIGGIAAWQGNDFTQVMYFTSEAEAREGEKKMAEQPQEEDTGWQQMVDNLKFIDLRDPWYA